MLDATTIEAIKGALMPVAEKIGQGAEYVWTTLVWGQFAEGLASLVCIGIAILVYIIVNIVICRFFNNSFTDKDERNVAGVFHLVVAGLLGLLLFGVSLDVGYDAVIKVIAPEYSAIKFLISQVK
jgi:hypothetical protein